MIETKKLVVEYRTKKALENIDVVIKPREATCILGPNGAGKTTFLKTIAKLVKYRGLVYIDGYEVSKTPLKTIAKLLSYIEPVKTSEFLNMTVIDALITAQYPVSKGFIEKRECFDKAFKVLEELGIGSFIYRKLNELSSGELQKIALAIGLVKNPNYLLFDEVDLHIDIGFKKTLVKLIKKWSIEKTVVFTTHDIIFGAITGDYFIVLNNGKVVYTGRREDLINKIDLLEQVFNTKVTIVKYNDKTIPVPVYL